MGAAVVGVMIYKENNIAPVRYIFLFLIVRVSRANK